MKINLPVTDVEYSLNDSDSIVSKSDLKGKITYANEGFIRISEFSKDELIGAPHNIVRHPDMPPEVFKDFWNALKAGRPWTGMIKNRTKHGGFYWALTNATPFYENDQLAGYMAVRIKPTRAQIDEASKAYKLMLDKKAGHLKIQDGKIIAVNALQNFIFWKDLSIRSRLIWVIGLLSILMVIIGGLGLQGMGKTDEGLRTVYKSRTVAMNQIFKISELQRDNLMLIASSLVTSTPEIVKQNNAELDQNIAEISRLWNAYLASNLTPDEKSLADSFTKAHIRLVQKGLQAAAEALAAKNLPLVNQIRDEHIRPNYRLANEDIRKLMQLQIEVAKQEYESAQMRYYQTRNIMLALIVTGIALALWLGFALIRAIVRPLDAAIGHFGHIAQGNYKTNIEIEGMNEIGKVMAALKAMQIKQGFDVAETKRVADEHMPVKIALDNVSTGLMIADQDRKIIYANKVVANILQKADIDICRQVPDFAATDLVGTSIDTFHSNPDHQAEMIASMRGTQIVHLEIGARSLVLTLNPVINEHGNRFGIVAEWQDRTIEVEIEKEIAAIIHAAAMGNFARRIKHEDKEGFFKQLAIGLNELLDTTENGINDVDRALSTLPHLDETKINNQNYSCCLVKLKEDTQTSVLKFKELVTQIRSALDGFNVNASDMIVANSIGETDRQWIVDQLVSGELLSTDAKLAMQLINEVHTQSDKSVDVFKQMSVMMNEISSCSIKVRGIISILDDIGTQTNTLSLIASVEAARAGDLGKGITVVAAEAKNLSEQVSKASVEVKELINDSVTKVCDSNQLIMQAGLTMEDIAKAMHEMSTVMTDISKISAAQMECIKQINHAIEKWTF